MARTSGGPSEAILLVGGRGTRLRPLTLTTPKPLLPAAGAPLLAHQLGRLRAAGVRRVILATSYQAETFRDLSRDGFPHGLELECVTEEQPLGTGGGIRNAAARLEGDADEPVLVLNGDVLSGHAIAAQVALHRESGAAVTLHLTRVTDARTFGCVPSDSRGRITGFHEKSTDPVTNWVNAGCYVFSRDALQRIPAGEYVSVENETFPALLDSGACLMAYPESGYWLDIGTPAAYVQGSCDLVLGRISSPASGGDGAAFLPDGCDVSADAIVDGGSALGNGAVVAPRAEVRGSVLFDDVTVGAGAVVRGSALARGVQVGEGAVLDGAVAGEAAVIGSGNEMRNGLRLWPGVEVPAGAVRFSSDA